MPEKLNLPKKGKLSVISGPMFSNKSGELLQQCEMLEIAGMKVELFKHSLDQRYDSQDIKTHSGRSGKAIPTSSILAIASSTADVIGIDEIQFFDNQIVDIIRDKIEGGIIVVVSGLDRDFKGDPFGPMPELLAMADEVQKLKAVCTVCKNLNATMTQRLINGEPARRDEPVILVGASESYTAVCRDCHRLL